MKKSQAYLKGRGYGSYHISIFLANAITSKTVITCLNDSELFNASELFNEIGSAPFFYCITEKAPITDLSSQEQCEFRNGVRDSISAFLEVVNPQPS